MSVRDPNGKQGNRRWDGRPEADGPLNDLANRLAEARRTGDPAPEELERLVALLSKSGYEPGTKLTDALEGLARWSDQDQDRDRTPEPVSSAPSSYDQPRPSPAPRRQPAPDELERRLADFANSLSQRGKAERKPEPAAAPSAPPIASLRSALADIAARQKALDSDEPAVPDHPAARPAPRPAPTDGWPISYHPQQSYERPAPVAPAQPEPASAAVVKELRSEIDLLGRAVAELPTRTEVDGLVREMSALANRLGADRPARLDRESLAAIDSLVAEVDRMRGDAASPQMIVSLADELHAISGRLDVIGPRNASAIDTLARRIDGVKAELETFPRTSALDGVAAEIKAVIGRLDAQEKIAAPTREAVAGLAGRVESLDGKIASIQQASAARDVALERINDAIRAELDDMPRTEAVTDLGRQIDALTEGLKSRTSIGPALKAVEGLAGRVEQLDGKIDAIVATRGDAEWIAEAMRGEIASFARPDALDGFARQIETLTATIRSQRPEPVKGAIEELSGKVMGLGDRMEKVAAQARDRNAALDRIEALATSIAAQRPEPVTGAIEALSGQISGLGERMEKVATLTRDRGVALDRIEAMTAGIATRRPEQTVEAVEALSGRIEGRIEGLGDRVDQMAAATRTRAAAFERIEESVRTIAEQLLDQRSGGGGIEAEVTRLVEGFDRNDDRIEDLHAAFAGLAARIERSCADLGAHCVESSVAAARDVTGSTGQGGRELDDEIARAIEDLRASSAQSERRSADTLEAVRSTLERLIDRMDDRRAFSPPAASPPAALRPASPLPAPPQPAPFAPEAVRREPPMMETAPPPAIDHVEAARAAARRALEDIVAGDPEPARRMPRAEQPPFPPLADLAPDHPIEPGAAPRGEQTAAQTAASFIAAARRAAAQPIVEDEPEPKAKSSGTKEPRTKEPGSRTAAIEGASLLAALKARRRPLLLGVAATLIVLAALYVASGMTGQMVEQEPVPAPTSQIEPAPQPRPSAYDAAPADAPRQTLTELDRKDAIAARTEATPPEARAEAAPQAPASGPATALNLPRTPAKDLTNFAFADANASRPRGPEWKAGEPSTTGSISRNANELPDQIGGATLRLRAVSGDPSAQLEVADRLLDGRNVEADPVAAARWLEKAAAQGLAPAQHRLGSLYEKGRGVARDVAAARRLYEQAAASGNVRAMHNLGVIHAEGGLGKPDFGAATTWFQMSADRGLVDSQYNLAVLRARGLGGKRDLVEAYKWFALAAIQGDEDAAKKREDVGKALGASVAVAKAAVDQFRPRPIDAAANDAPTPPGGWDRIAATRGQ